MIPKKSLGQNFLINKNIAERIANSADIHSANVLEIGPGQGILTKYLAEYAKKILAVEIDRDLANSLSSVIASEAKQSRVAQDGSGLLRHYDKLQIINGDILKINLPKLIEENNFQKYKVVANLPYYITSKIIRLFLETQYPPAEMILMVQKEVGERIVALDGKESILSISVKFYADPEILFEVGRENFEPAPEVDSVVIHIKRKPNPPEADASEFFALVRAGFSAKRKTLLNNLSAGFHIPKVELSEKIKKSGLKPGVRAEKLGVEEWIKLYKNINF